MSIKDIISKKVKEQNEIDAEIKQKQLAEEEQYYISEDKKQADKIIKWFESKFFSVKSTDDEIANKLYEIGNDTVSFMYGDNAETANRYKYSLVFDRWKTELEERIGGGCRLHFGSYSVPADSRSYDDFYTEFGVSVTWDR